MNNSAKNNSALPYWLGLAVVLSGLYAGYKVYEVQRSSASSSVVATELPPLENFELTDQNGKPFRSADMKGKVWVASFFFSNCNLSCARLNANIKYLTTLEELKDVTWVSITVDPQTDTVPVLKAYAESLHADTERWHFCRDNDFDYVKRVADDVLRVGGVAYKGHNDYVVVVDKSGKVANMFNGYSQDDLEKGVKLLKKILAEPAPANAAPSNEAAPSNAAPVEAAPVEKLPAEAPPAEAAPAEAA